MDETAYEIIYIIIPFVLVYTLIGISFSYAVDWTLFDGDPPYKKERLIRICIISGILLLYMLKNST